MRKFLGNEYGIHITHFQNVQHLFCRKHFVHGDNNVGAAQYAEKRRYPRIGG